MNLIKKLLLFGVFICTYGIAHAQIEVTHVSSKDFTATGFGGFLNFSIPVTETDAVTLEGAAYVYSSNDSHMVVVPALVGWRHLLDPNNDYGFYTEPVAGYSFGATDIQKYDANGNALNDANGNQIDQKVAGPTAGFGFGYLFPESGRIRFNISLRYEHTFVVGDPALNIISLRVSHSFTF
jgi:hypothetical protein